MSEAGSSGFVHLLESPLRLPSFCKPIRFEPGALLRQQGQHYKEMYLITSGRVEVRQGNGRVATLEVGSPVGEIGFLRGTAAIATVTATMPTGALVIDDATLVRLEQEQPAMTAGFLRCLAAIAEERTSYNLISTPARGAYLSGARAIEVHLCRNEEMLQRAQRLRYEVYCHELGRQSPYADHDRRLIADELDKTGHTFIAIEAGETTGTLRGNRPSEGSLELLEELYGMRQSPHHPHATAVATKFIVKKSRRGGPTAIKLLSALIRYGMRNQIRECYADSIPALLSYYKAIGFRMTGDTFLHRENGPSQPMVIDVERHGHRLSKEFGAAQYLRLYAMAKAIKWIDDLRGNKAIHAEVAST